MLYVRITLYNACITKKKRDLAHSAEADLKGKISACQYSRFLYGCQGENLDKGLKSCYNDNRKRLPATVSPQKMVYKVITALVGELGRLFLFCDYDKSDDLHHDTCETDKILQGYVHRASPSFREIGGKETLRQ